MSGVPAFKRGEAGFSQPQVEALAKFLQTEAARRSDLEGAEHRLDTRISDGGHRLETRITELKADIADLKADSGGVKAEVLLLKWMLGVVLAFIVAIFIKLFMH